MMFAAPPEHTLEWSDEGVEGAFRFMKRLWKIVHAHVQAGPAAAPDVASLDPAQRELRRQVHQTLAKVGDDIGRRRTFNTAIAAVMELLNSLVRFTDSSPQGRAVMQEALDLVVLMLSPIVPHAAHALWRALGHVTAVVDEAWPEPDSSRAGTGHSRNRRASQWQAAWARAGAGRRRRGDGTCSGACGSRRRAFCRRPAGAQASLRPRQARQRGDLMRQSLLYLAVGWMTLMSGCGFHLRGQASLPAALATPYLEASDRYTPLHAALAARLRAAGAKLATDPATASAVIHLHKDETGRELLSVSARNTPGEFEVYYTVEYSVSAGGSDLLARQRVTLTRDFSYDETAVLAKEREEQSLRAALADELAGLMLRRLAAL